MPRHRALAAAVLAVGLAAAAPAAQAAPLGTAAPSTQVQVAAASPAAGATHLVVQAKKPKPKAYKNCTALVKVYPHGVGKPGAHDKGGKVTGFTRDAKTYALNKKSDRDKDGIACER